MVEFETPSFIGTKLTALVEWIGRSKRKIETPMKRTARPRTPKFALCLRNDGNPASLEVFKVYRIVKPHAKDDPEDIRIIDESGEDYLYPRENFLPLDLPARAVRASKLASA